MKFSIVRTAGFWVWQDEDNGCGRGTREEQIITRCLEYKASEKRLREMSLFSPLGKKTQNSQPKKATKNTEIRF